MIRRGALLVLADGAVFEGEADRRRPAGRGRRGRGGVQHGAVRLPGGHHRPELRRPDHHLHLPPHRQLRRQRRRLRGPPPVLPGRGRPRAGPAPLAAGGPRATSTPCSRATASPASPASTPAGSPATSATPARCRARSAPPTRPTLRGGRRGRAGHRRRRPRRRGHHARALHGRRRARVRVVAYDFGIKRTHPAPPRRARPRSRWCRPRRPPPTSSPASPTACSCPTDPATRPMVPYAGRRHRRAARRGAGVRHLPRPPAAGPGHRRRDREAARSATTAATTRCSDLRHRPGRDHQPEPQLRRRRRLAAGRAEVTHVNLNDGVCEGLRVPERAGVQRAVPPRGRPRPPRQPLPVRRVRRPDGASAASDLATHGRR